jgi:hypothetical protein
MKYILLFITLSLVLPSLAADRVQAETAPVWDSSSLSSITGNSHPALQGNCLAWQARGGLTGATSTPEDWEIFAYDLIRKVVIQITDDSLDDILPATDGTNIVWQKNGMIVDEQLVGSHIFLYQLNGTIPPGGMQISPVDDADHFSPAVAKGNVIWSRQEIEQDVLPREILLYNAVSRTGPTVISDTGFNSSQPRISGSKIVFQQAKVNQESDKTLFIYDTADAQPLATPAPADFVWYANPQVDGEQTVLSRYSGSNREIFLHTPAKGCTQLTDNTMDDTNPVISKNHVGWIAENNIYLVKIPSPATAPGALPFIYLLLLNK